MTTASTISHWHTLIDQFSLSGKDFFESVEAAVKEREVPDTEFSRVLFKEGGLASAKREYLRVQRKKTAFDLTAFPYGTGMYFGWWLKRVGPKHPWLWLLGFFGALFIWTLTLLVFVPYFGRLLGIDLGGCMLFLFPLCFPVGLIAFGWAIQENKVPIDEEDVLAIPFVGWLYEKLFAPNTMYSLDTAIAMQESVSRAVNEVIDDLLTGQGLHALTDEAKKPTMRLLAQ